MRLIKMLGLAAMAAVVATAFIGAATASAEFNTVLCEKAELICESPVNGGGNVEIHLETLAANPPLLLSSAGTVECEKSLALLTLLNELAKAPAKQEAHILSLSFTGNCHLGETSCTVTTNDLGSLLLLKTGELKAIATDMELEGHKTKVTLKCGFFINCTFSANAKTSLAVSSDAEGHLTGKAEATPLTGSGFLCPEKGNWDAEYHAIDLETGKPLPNLYIES